MSNGRGDPRTPAALYLYASDTVLNDIDYTRLHSSAGRKNSHVMQLSEMLNSGVDVETWEIRDLDIISSFHPLFPIVISKNTCSARRNISVIKLAQIWRERDRLYHLTNRQPESFRSRNRHTAETKSEPLFRESHADIDDSKSYYTRLHPCKSPGHRGQAQLLNQSNASKELLSTNNCFWELKKFPNPRTEVAEVGDVNIAAGGCGIAELNTQFAGRKYSGGKSFSISSQIDSLIKRRDKDDRCIEGKPVTTGTQSVESRRP
ncbi:hypothetical protein EDB85DRAFT_1894196 [Lactarius pseudohatsudake]|nr:hypothetical protein EDB85DRAFT_1894196 [Lactarius pseudohatsudake]